MQNIAATIARALERANSVQEAGQVVPPHLSAATAFLNHGQPMNIQAVERITIAQALMSHANIDSMVDECERKLADATEACASRGSTRVQRKKEKNVAGLTQHYTNLLAVRAYFEALEIRSSLSQGVNASFEDWTNSDPSVPLPRWQDEARQHEQVSNEGHGRAHCLGNSLEAIARNGSSRENDMEAKIKRKVQNEQKAINLRVRQNLGPMAPLKPRELLETAEELDIAGKQAATFVEALPVAYDELAMSKAEIALKASQKWRAHEQGLEKERRTGVADARGDAKSNAQTVKNTRMHQMGHEVWSKQPDMNELFAAGVLSAQQLYEIVSPDESSRVLKSSHTSTAEALNLLGRGKRVTSNDPDLEPTRIIEAVAAERLHPLTTSEKQNPTEKLERTEEPELGEEPQKIAEHDCAEPPLEEVSTREGTISSLEEDINITEADQQPEAAIVTTLPRRLHVPLLMGERPGSMRTQSYVDRVSDRQDRLAIVLQAFQKQEAECEREAKAAELEAKKAHAAEKVSQKAARLADKAADSSSHSQASSTPKGAGRTAASYRERRAMGNTCLTGEPKENLTSVSISGGLAVALSGLGSNRSQIAEPSGNPDKSLPGSRGQPTRPGHWEFLTRESNIEDSREYNADEGFAQIQLRGHPLVGHKGYVSAQDVFNAQQKTRIFNNIDIRWVPNVAARACDCWREGLQSDQGNISATSSTDQTSKREAKTAAPSSSSGSERSKSTYDASRKTRNSSDNHSGVILPSKVVILHIQPEKLEPFAQLTAGRMTDGSVPTKPQPPFSGLRRKTLSRQSSPGPKTLVKKRKYDQVSESEDSDTQGSNTSAAKRPKAVPKVRPPVKTRNGSEEEGKPADSATSHGASKKRTRGEMDDNPTPCKPTYKRQRKEQIDQAYSSTYPTRGYWPSTRTIDSSACRTVPARDDFTEEERGLSMSMHEIRNLSGRALADNFNEATHRPGQPPRSAESLMAVVTSLLEPSIDNGRVLERAYTLPEINRAIRIFGDRQRRSDEALVAEYNGLAIAASQPERTLASLKRVVTAYLKRDAGLSTSPKKGGR